MHFLEQNTSLLLPEHTRIIHDELSRPHAHGCFECHQQVLTTRVPSQQRTVREGALRECGRCIELEHGAEVVACGDPLFSLGGAVTQPPPLPSPWPVRGI